MKRKHALLYLFGIWMIVLLFPPLRNPARVQLAGSRIIAFAVWPRATHWRFFVSRARWDRLAHAAPQNATLAVQRVEAAIINEDEDRNEYYYVPPPAYAPGTSQPLNNEFQLRHLAMRKSYDGLLKRFPKDGLTPFLLARRLEYTFKWMAPRRIGGEVSSMYPGSTLDRREGRENFSRRDVNAAIAIAKRGQQLEPENAYFDWALCKLLLIAWRDDEALKTLALAAKKTRFDDHQNDLKRIALRAHAIALGRPLLWEEKVRVLSTTLSPEYEYYGSPIVDFETEALSILAWKSLRAGRRGDHKTALRWAEYAMRLAAMLRRNANFQTRSARASIELNLQNQLARDLMTKQAASRMRRPYRGGAIFRQTFQDYATHHGRPDVARLAARTFKEANAIYASSASSRDYQIGKRYGMAPFPMALLTLSWVAGVLLLFSILGMLCGLVLLEALLHWWQRRKRAGVANRATPHIPRKEIIGGVLACSGLRAIACAVAAAIGGGLCFLLGAAIVVPQDEILRGFGEFQKFVTAPSFWSDFLAFWPSLWSDIGTALQNGDEIPFFFHFVAPLFPVLLGVLYAQWRAVNRQRLQNGEGEEPRFGPFLRGISNGTFFRAGFDYDFSRAVLKLFDWLLFLACLAVWLILAFWMDDEFDEYWWIAILAIALGLTGAVMLGNLIRWRRRPNRREAARYHLQLLRVSLWGWLVAASTLYLLALLFSVPLRHDAEHRLERVLQLGEVRATQMP